MRASTTIDAIPRVRLTDDRRDYLCSADSKYYFCLQSYALSVGKIRRKYGKPFCSQFVCRNVNAIGVSGARLLLTLTVYLRSLSVDVTADVGDVYSAVYTYRTLINGNV